MKSPLVQALLRLLIVALVALRAGPLHAADDDDSDSEEAKAPPDVSGVVDPGEQPGDGVRKALDGVLWFPRQFVEVAFLLSGVAAGLIEDEQLVPRVDRLFNPRHGEIYVFPTLFAETRVPLNVGVRAVARAGRLGSSVRVGFGGVDDLLMESRIHVQTNPWTPGLVSLEVLTDLQSSLEYRGVGNDPRTDARNTFVGPQGVGHYSENRERFIASFGTRPLDGDVELFLSASMSRRRPTDSSDGPLSAVFDPTTVPGFNETSRVIYAEFAARYDSRASRQGIEPGASAEIYGGHAFGIADTHVTYLRSGARAAAFFPIYKRTNVIAPKVVMDILQPLDGTVPFTFQLRQPDFRGPVERTDEVSFVASVDYQWRLAEFMAARVFVDGTAVSPRIVKLPFDRMTYAVGIGVDAFGDSALIGSMNLSFNHEGVRFSLRIGVPPIFGDRQHRQ